jgi:geranylgeranyl reductase family protein
MGGNGILYFGGDLVGVDTVDVCIIGAGPAGASAALELERRQVGYILFDKAGFPREKPCAGILPPKMIDLVGPLPVGVFERRIKGYFLHTVSGAAFRSRFPRPGYSVDRTRFDSWLVSKLRAPPRQEAFDDAIEEEGVVHVRTARSELRCRVLIGADGANSRVRASAGIPAGRMAVATQAGIPVAQNEITKRTGGWFHVFYIVPGGYGWVAPHSRGLLVGIGSILPKFAGREALDKFLSAPGVRALTGGHEVDNVCVHRIPMSGPLRRVGHGRILLAGDAGGFVFPGTGEGIRFAMESGNCAARAAAETVLGEGPGAMLQGAYKRRLSEEGLLSLREVDFHKVLKTPRSAESYVRALTSLSRTASSS